MLCSIELYRRFISFDSSTSKVTILVLNSCLKAVAEFNYYSVKVDVVSICN